MSPNSKLWTALGCLVLAAERSQAGGVDGHHGQYTSTADDGENWTHVKHPTPIRESTSCSTNTTSFEPLPPTTYHSKSRYTIVTATVETTITTCLTTTTPTPTSTFNPCPTECSVSAGTVELFYWPTDKGLAYPSIYVEPSLNYTFTSPSVYMLINTIRGYNSLGPTGPSATSTIFPLDLNEVSTIVPGSGATRQLSLSDLGTNCPRTAEPSVIATMVAGGPCDPVLAAPEDVKSWASPCGACGPFGLFDPPYAIPPVTTTSVPTITPPPATTTSTTPVPTTLQTAGASRAVNTLACLSLVLLAAVILL